MIVTHTEGSDYNYPLGLLTMILLLPYKQTLNSGQCPTSCQTTSLDPCKWWGSCTGPCPPPSRCNQNIIRELCRQIWLYSASFRALMTVYANQMKQLIVDILIETGVGFVETNFLILTFLMFWYPPKLFQMAITTPWILMQLQTFDIWCRQKYILLKILKFWKSFNNLLPIFIGIVFEECYLKTVESVALE